MINITDYITNHELSKLVNLDYFFSIPNSNASDPFQTRFWPRAGNRFYQEELSFHTLGHNATFERGRGTFDRFTGDLSEKFTFYSQTSQLDFRLLPNSNNLGVRLLELDLTELVENIQSETTYMIASGRLSACIACFFLIDGKVYFIHEGGTNSDTRSNKTLVRCNDIIHSLQECNLQLNEIDYNVFNGRATNLVIDAFLQELSNIRGLVYGCVAYGDSQMLQNQYSVGRVKCMNYMAHDNRALPIPQVVGNGQMFCIINQNGLGVCSVSNSSYDFRALYGNICKVSRPIN